MHLIQFWSLWEDPSREGLLKTPMRAAKAFEFFTTGYKQSVAGKHNWILFVKYLSSLFSCRCCQRRCVWWGPRWNGDSSRYWDFLSVRASSSSILGQVPHRIYSTWESFRYCITRSKVVNMYFELIRSSLLGLSKLARISEVFSRRLQVQERLTRQIAQAIMEVLEPAGVAVVIECSHMCMVRALYSWACCRHLYACRQLISFIHYISFSKIGNARCTEAWRSNFDQFDAGCVPRQSNYKKRVFASNQNDKITPLNNLWDWIELHELFWNKR